MAQKLTVPVTAEYRGVQAGGTFNDRETGAEVSFGPKLKFEVEDPTGDVALLAFREGDFDKASPPFDCSTLSKGDELELMLQVVIGDRDGDRSYLRVLSAQPASSGAKLKPVPAAAAS